MASRFVRIDEFYAFYTIVFYRIKIHLTDLQLSNVNKIVGWVKIKLNDSNRLTQPKRTLKKGIKYHN